MSIILQNQHVKGDISFVAGLLDIDLEDPSLTRADAVLLDLTQRSIGLIFSDALHHVGELPHTINSAKAMTMTRARLHGHGAGGKEIQLNAPIKIIGQA